MKENISSPELTLNIWSNDACRGYVIMAMQDCGFTHKDISRVVNQLYGVFDLYTLNEAEQSKRSIASTCSSTPFSAIIVSHYTESKKLSTQLF